jgi:hypothetical protein
MFPFPVYGAVQAPVKCYLQRYDDEGDCVTQGSTDCKAGAANCVALIFAYVNYPVGDTKHMPPPPSDPLNSWEKDILSGWFMNPDPATGKPRR